MTVNRKCESPKRGLKDIKEVCQLTKRCDRTRGVPVLRKGVMVMWEM